MKWNEFTKQTRTQTGAQLSHNSHEPTDERWTYSESQGLAATWVNNEKLSEPYSQNELDPFL